MVIAETFVEREFQADPALFCPYIGSTLYPYPFLEVSKLGYPQVLLNTVMLAVGFCVISAIFIGIARLTQRDRHTREIRS